MPAKGTILSPKVERVCGRCGKTFSVYPSTVRCQPARYCSQACHWASQRGETHGSWKGGRWLDTDGYVHIFVDGTYRWEHRIVMEQHIGRPLAKGELVHHINGVKDDNRIENLQIVTRAEHNALHGCKATGRWTRKHSCCVRCGTSEIPHAGHGLCRRCKYHPNP